MNLNEDELDNLYNTILSDPRMQEVSDDVPFPKTDLIPSCIVTNLLYDPRFAENFIDDSNDPYDHLDPRLYKDTTRAYPPRRFVKVAQGFGPTGIVQSICEDSFKPVMNAIIDTIARQLGEPCLARKLSRNAQGLVDCRLIWKMPKGKECTEPMYSAFLEDPEDGLLEADDGRRRCQVTQLAVSNPDALSPLEALKDRSALGWYYDDFSQDIQKVCTRNRRQRIALRIDTETGLSGYPPSGTTVYLDCTE